ncbi:unnamed protein product [Penicillium salamii]|uniref:Enoyl reductase (ER) domain-containing protein n=1 Tax=Penicillium salamii TaxID=1612424 RepID=A0A9W4JPA0_9EURO|nr:unnamed protein product [Penicillium salamii]CAG8060593.1 unnamed protein product [Penicillium salamii]CAG8163388.1 unnamed protein product [Penicillium salamii]CAG8165147.1 unnamed protein product [Penicillium salamii]CAG8230923.1 unnamed protein product [Penicillium salamii]
MATMKALQITGTKSLSINTLPIPILKSGQALVKVYYSCIHPSDRLNAQGLFPSTTLPRVPGRDYSGVVTETNPTSNWIGKEVYGTSGSSLGFTSDGPHAQYICVPQDALVEKPSTLSMLQAATVGVPFTTGLICLRRASVSSTDSVLVIGSTGAVGTAAVQMARAMGCKRILTAARREEAKPDIVISGESAAETLALRIGEMTGGRGVDVVVDTVGDLALMGAAVEKLAQKGRYVWIAAPRGEASKNFSFDIFQAYRKELMLAGCNSVSPTVEDAAELLRFLGDWVENGSLCPQDETSFRKVNLEDCIEDGYGKAGERVVIKMV